MARRRGIRVRRSRHLVCYWRSGIFLVHNYATGVSAAVSPLARDLLDACTEWRTSVQLHRSVRPALPESRSPAALVDELIARLSAMTFLERSDARPPAAEAAMSALDRWNPAVGFFHTATKDVRFLPHREADQILRKQARTWPMPRPVKRYRRVPIVRLPPVAAPRRAFIDVVRARRTWRRFSSAPLTVSQVATLLGLAAGVQQWVKTGTGEVPLKTSPSGGARHPIECYAAVRRVEGVRPGLYHYAADAHRLEVLRRGDLTDRLRVWMPQSRYFARAALVVIFTAVFERQLWRYPYGRAYRAALIEAGHVCQTFCLAATSLGLAPFCLMGLADREIERDLRIDGIRETVLYAAGAGVPPRGVTWAPLSRGALKTRPNPALQA